MYNVSVIIPTYNRKAFLTNAIDSVLSQTYQNLELIIIDDGSSDKSLDFIKKKYPKIRFFKQRNKGVSSARNKGIKLSSYEWVAFLDSDDRWHPKKLEKQINYLIKYSKYEICHTDEVWIKNGSKINQHKKHQKFGGFIFDKCLDICKISPSSVIVNKKIFKKIGLFDESLPVCEDYDLWLRILVKFPILYLNEKLTIKYGGHLNQLSKKYWGMDRFRIKTLENLIKNNSLDNKKKSIVKKKLKEKIDIYLNGLKKRNKKKEIIFYENKKKKYK
ncbi:MAG: UDP-Glc:alpha-D-GlcNAc-diphosphoundecaprenol beta-1,3-glucosyltransferase WfgD [Alphaproteobacteria bacterium MarineAlpha6_Bin5]|nr:MAG: UDP-Glc:alpha-D-GlcNAc-diphosphoundecaprenol beta-1,3-glucosyltransferase WfgD [Alphaproteobacteria bacterium MarineAlpha6_Bin5]|tara:strand:+ start:1842 stop:2663 length:822 start_codon:yes stop_codon:yes gene_type:complete